MIPPRYDPVEASVDGHTLRVAVTGADRLAALLDLIEGAVVSLRLFFYIFGDDETANRVRNALIAARMRGVKVWLLVDGYGCTDRPDSVFQPLVDAGVVFARFHSKFGRRYLLRNHQKIVVADEARALVGGSNVVDHYFADDPEGNSWHDLYVTVEGPAAARLARYFDGLRRWMLSDRPSLRGLVHILSRRSEPHGPLRWMFNGPFRRISPLTLAVKRDIDVVSRLDMIQAYFAPNWGMLRRLRRIGKRGGQFRMVSAARSDNLTTISAARHCYRRLLLSGATLYEYTPQMLHMKLIVADGVVYIGSANFDMRSLFINAEIMLRVEDAGFAAKMRHLFEAHLPNSDEVTREEHRARSTPFARLRWLVSYFLVSTLDYTVTRRFTLRR
jgi:cardiolipin synthase A/B